MQKYEIAQTANLVVLSRLQQDVMKTQINSQSLEDMHVGTITHPTGQTPKLILTVTLSYSNLEQLFCPCDVG